MIKSTTRLLVLLLAVLWLMPSAAWAYSYGNANSEDIANAYTDMNAALGAATPDWAKAKADYEERKAELATHFGAKVPEELDAAFAAQDKDRVLKDMKGVLVLNIERRFKYAIEGMSDYSQTKLLLAKARATFEALKPALAGELGDDALKTTDGQFETALDALGNPGLFGAGKKEANPELFKSTLQAIQDKLTPLYPFEGAVIMNGEAAEAGSSSASPSAGGAAAGETSKTNPAVTIGVLAGVVIVGAGVAWWVRKRRQ